MSTVKDILHKRMKTKKKKNYTDQTLLLYMCEKICTEKCKTIIKKKKQAKNTTK